MASRIFSIRLDDRVVEALEALQLPDDDSLNTTLKRFVINGLGITVNTPVNTVNNDERLQELVREEVENVLNTIASQERFQETVHIIVNGCIQNQNDILSDHEFRLGKLEESAQEVFSSTPQVLSLPVSTKPTAMPTAVNYAAKATDDNPPCPICGINDYVSRHSAGRWMCKNIESHPNKKNKTFS